MSRGLKSHDRRASAPRCHKLRAQSSKPFLRKLCVKTRHRYRVIQFADNTCLTGSPDQRNAQVATKRKKTYRTNKRGMSLALRLTKLTLEASAELERTGGLASQAGSQSSKLRSQCRS